MLSLSCINPLHVTNNGNDVYVQCNSCFACKVSKSNNLSRLGFCDSQGCVNYFVTLTYNRENMPYLNVMLDKMPNSEAWNMIYFDNDSQVIYEKVIFRKQYEKIKTISAYYSKRYGIRCQEGCYILPVLDYFGLRNYLKRVRIKVQRKYGLRLRVQYCGEYGPTTQRPHYHVIFTVENNEQSRTSEFAYFMYEVCRASWEYGHTFTERATSSTSSYLSSYLAGQSATDSPYLQTPFRPRFLHSKFFGLGFSEREETDFMQKLQAIQLAYDGKLPTFQHVSKSGKVSLLSVSAYDICRYFLKLPQGYGLADVSRLFGAFHAFNVLSYARGYQKYNYTTKAIIHDIFFNVNEYDVKKFLNVVPLHFNEKIFEYLKQNPSECQPNNFSYGNYAFDYVYRIIRPLVAYSRYVGYFGNTFVLDSVFRQVHYMAINEGLQQKRERIIKDGLDLSRLSGYLHTQKTWHVDKPQSFYCYRDMYQKTYNIFNDSDKSKKFNDNYIFKLD